MIKLFPLNFKTYSMINTAQKCIMQLCTTNHCQSQKEIQLLENPLFGNITNIARYMFRIYEIISHQVAPIHHNRYSSI
jgi:hypothetical protein